MSFQIKRIYESASPKDGLRVLVDRLWPRGVAKKNALLDFWLKEAAPTPQLRSWFGHKPERFAEFAKRYRQELKGNPALADLRKLGKGKIVTLLYAAHDPKVNHALVLLSVLKPARKRAVKRAAPATRKANG